MRRERVLPVRRAGRAFPVRVARGAACCAAWCLAGFVACGPAAARPAHAAAAGALGAQPARSGNPPWDQWRHAWDRGLQEESRGSVTLARLAALNRERARIEESLCTSLQQPASVPAPRSKETFAWARGLLLSGLARGDPRLLALAQTRWDPQSMGEWNRDGAFTLQVALSLMDLSRPGDALGWLDAAAADTSEEPFVASLRVEAALASGDSAGAEKRAEAALPRHSWPSWTRADLEQGRIWGLLSARDTSGARAALADFSQPTARRGFYWSAWQRLARERNRSAQADSFGWRLADEFPAGSQAAALLHAKVTDSGAVLKGLKRGEVRILLAVCEARLDLDRFHGLRQTLERELSSTGSDSLLLREARLAFRARQYEELLGLERRGARPETPSMRGEWDLLLARSLRNSAQPDSMAHWYQRAAATGSPEERATAYWEWARELEAQRRFAEADSLYQHFLALGGNDRRAEARLRQGIDSFARGDWKRAAGCLERAASEGQGAMRQAAWFWLYQCHLGAGDRDSARSCLARAARDSAGYYAMRARSALLLESRGVKLDDPAGYWAALAKLGSDPSLGSAVVPAGARDRIRGAQSPVETEGGLARERDRLLLFRRCGRRDWAASARERLLAWPGLGSGRERVRRLLSLGLPDLAARAAAQDGALPRALRFPLPFAEEVAGEAAERTISPEWIWGVMREESFFESAAISPAGAVGLMQLMQATAQTTAEKHGLPAEPLTSPAVNLALGVAHLRDLAAEEPGQWPVVVAAYNAGLPNARRWRRVGEGPDLYVEMIGYRETRQYVQDVLEAFWTYRMILRQGR